MDLSNLKDWKMAKCGKIPSWEPSKLVFLVTKSAQMKHYRKDHFSECVKNECM